MHNDVCAINSINLQNSGMSQLLTAELSFILGKEQKMHCSEAESLYFGATVVIENSSCFVEKVKK